MLKSLWILSLVAMVTNGYTFTCNQSTPSSGGPEIPHLPNQYETTVETNIIQKQKTIQVLESYDQPGRRFALTLIDNGQVRKSIHNFDTQERYDIMANNSCVTSNINSTSGNFNIFGFTVRGSDGNMTIASVNDVFMIGKKYNNTYIGETQIRGIPVYQWSSCQVSSELHASFKLDYYFSRPGYTNSNGNESVPIRFTITGQAMNRGGSGYHNFSHVYEFTAFKPGPIRDRTVFETPAGVVCTGRKSSVPLPKIPDQFTIDVEADFKTSHRPVSEKVYFDYQNLLVRMDRVYDKEQKHKYGAGLISRIEDYSTGLEYVMDRVEDNCTILPISDRILFARSLPNHHNITLKHSQELLKIKNFTFVYQGERMWRGLQVDAWANVSHDNVVHECYFLKQAPVTGRPTPTSILVGMFIKNITEANLQQSQTAPAGSGSQGPGGQPGPGGQLGPGGPGVPTTPAGPGAPGQHQTPAHARKLPAEMYIHHYNFHEGHPDLEVFDISPCYKGLKNQGSSLGFTFSIEESYKDYVYGHKSIFYPPLRTVLAKSANVSAMRIASIQVVQDESNAKKMIVNFKVLDKIPMKGDVARPPKQISLKEAKNNLMKAANIGIKFPVHYPQHSMVFLVKVYSFKTVPQVSNLSMAPSGYSAGSMAGLGIGMLIFGCIIGLLIAFIIHRRITTDVPYERSQ